MPTTIQLKRRHTGAAGTPATLASGELFNNDVDETLYVGTGDNGSGVATDIVPVGGKGVFPTKAEARNASNLTSGTVPAARLPAAVFQAPIVSSGGLGALTTAQQAKVVEGTAVLTTDGKTQMYKGSGSKTAAGSYIFLADTTPDWSAIAGKPANFPPTGHTHPLSQISGTGSMAAQNSNAVSITGGSINNVVIDGGTF